MEGIMLERLLKNESVVLRLDGVGCDSNLEHSKHLGIVRP